MDSSKLLIFLNSLATSNNPRKIRSQVLKAYSFGLGGSYRHINPFRSFLDEDEVFRKFLIFSEDKILDLKDEEVRKLYIALLEVVNYRREQESLSQCGRSTSNV